MKPLYVLIGGILSCLVAAPGVSSAAQAPRMGCEYWIPNSETDSAGQHGIHFRKFVNGSAHRPKYPFQFQRWDEPLLGELNRRLGIDSLVAGSRDDLEAASRIALKVCNLWAHSAPVEYPVWSALEILDRVAQGEQYWCTYKQLVTMQALASIGLVSRIVPCSWHHSLEYWSNDYDKWVVMDAWTANYYRRDGVPLGALELEKYSHATGSLKGSGVWEININPNRWKPERTQDSIPADSQCYIYVRYIARNDFLSSPLAPKPAGNPGDYGRPNNQLNDLIQSSLPHVAWWQPGDTPPIVCPTVRYEEDWNFPLDEVEMTLQRPLTREGALDVSLDTHTPEFDTYLCRLDNGQWLPCGSRILWELKPGANSLELRSRNKWGRPGAVSRAVLDYRPEELLAPEVARLEIPDPGFEDAAQGLNPGSGGQPGGWRLIYTDKYQEPRSFGVAKANPHSGAFCYRLELADPPIRTRLKSRAFPANPASDVTLRIWLRADREGREATLFLEDATPGGPAAQAVWQRRVTLGRDWSMYELKARLTARTTSLMAGVQALSGTLWCDDFSISEEHRAGLPW